jgi:hypothetical protein
MLFYVVDCDRMVEKRILTHRVRSLVRYQVAKEVADEINLTGGVWSLVQADHNYRTRLIIW